MEVISVSGTQRLSDSTQQKAVYVVSDDGDMKCAGGWSFTSHPNLSPNDDGIDIRPYKKTFYRAIMVGSVVLLMVIAVCLTYIVTKQSSTNAAASPNFKLNEGGPSFLEACADDPNWRSLFDGDDCSDFSPALCKKEDREASGDYDFDMDYGYYQDSNGVSVLEACPFTCEVCPGQKKSDTAAAADNAPADVTGTEYQDDARAKAAAAVDAADIARALANGCADDPDWENSDGDGCSDFENIKTPVCKKSDRVKNEDYDEDFHYMYYEDSSGKSVLEACPVTCKVCTP